MFFRKSRSQHDLQGGVTSQRFEMKYVLNAFQAELIREQIAPYVRADPKARDGHGYDLSSVYLDSSRLDLFWSSNLGEAKRHKLRVRTYSEDPAAPVFFEIKSRYNGVVLKKRATVAREWIRECLEGHPVPGEAVVSGDPIEAENLALFQARMEEIGAIPRLHVRYTRDAYMSLDDDPVRITFDHNIACLPTIGMKDKVRMNGPGWRHLPDNPVILEVKFTDSYPCWVQELVQRFSLLRDSFAKYVVCVHMLRGEGYDLKYDAREEEVVHGRAG